MLIGDHSLLPLRINCSARIGCATVLQLCMAAPAASCLMGPASRRSWSTNPASNAVQCAPFPLEAVQDEEHGIRFCSLDTKCSHDFGRDELIVES